MKFKTLALAFGVSAAAVGIGGTYVYNMAYKYSEGARPGTIFKISEKGALCKSWEGQMNMHGYGRVDGQGSGMTSYFEFSVLDDELAKKIQDAQITGKTVNIEYRQVKWKWSCLQETDYVATNIQELDQSTGRYVPYMIMGSNAPVRKR